jgi:hypothetical protein
MMSLSLSSSEGWRRPRGTGVGEKDQLKDGGARDWCGGGARAAIGAAHSGCTPGRTIVA